MSNRLCRLVFACIIASPGLLNASDAANDSLTLKPRFDLTWGVGYQQHQKNAVGIAQFMEMAYPIVQNISVYIHVEEQSLEPTSRLDDDIDINYAGVGIWYDIYSDIGMGLGMGHVQSETHDTPWYGDISVSVGLLTARLAEIDYTMDLRMIYRVGDPGGAFIPEPVDSLSGFQLAIATNVHF